MTNYKELMIDGEAPPAGHKDYDEYIKRLCASVSEIQRIAWENHLKLHPNYQPSIKDDYDEDCGVSDKEFDYYTGQAGGYYYAR